MKLSDDSQWKQKTTNRFSLFCFMVEIKSEFYLWLRVNPASDIIEKNPYYKRCQTAKIAICDDNEIFKLYF